MITDRILKHFIGTLEQFKEYFAGLDSETKALINSAIVFIHEAGNKETGWIYAKGEYYTCGGTKLDIEGNVVNIKSKEVEGDTVYYYETADGEEVEVDEAKLSKDAEGNVVTGDYLRLSFDPESYDDDAFVLTSSLVKLDDYYKKEEINALLSDKVTVTPNEETGNLDITVTPWVQDEDGKWHYDTDSANTYSVPQDAVKSIDRVDVVEAKGADGETALYEAGDVHFVPAEEDTPGYWAANDGAVAVEYVDEAGAYLHIEHSAEDEEDEYILISNAGASANIEVVSGDDDNLEVVATTDPETGKVTYTVTPKLAKIDPAIGSTTDTPDTPAVTDAGLVTGEVLSLWVAYQLSWEELNA